MSRIDKEYLLYRISSKATVDSNVIYLSIKDTLETALDGDIPDIDEVRDYSYFISCGFYVVTSTKFDKQHIPFSEFGKTIFITQEALKEREK